MTQYAVLYDIHTHHNPLWIVAILVPLIVGGLAVVITRLPFPSGRPAGPTSYLWGYLIALGSLVIGAQGWIALYTAQTQALRRLETGQYSVVEGPLLAFHPGSWTTPEQLEVDDHRYTYSLAQLDAGLSRPFGAHGPLRPSVFVRIFAAHGRILRLEMKR